MDELERHEIRSGETSDLISEKYKQWIARQIQGKGIVCDKDVLEMRKRDCWMHDPYEIQEKIAELNDVKGAARQIDISRFINSRVKSPKLTYPIL